MEDHDGPSTGSTRRRVLKASAALSATGVVGGGFVETAAAGHEPGSCVNDVQCDAGVRLDDQTVGDGTCPAGTTPDSVMVRSVHVSCELGGWIDLHDLTRTVGPSGTFKAGYPVGMSTMLQQGTHTDIEICLFQNSVAVPNDDDCQLDWTRTEWPSDTTPTNSRSMSAMLHLDSPDDEKIKHYCKHENPQQGEDHAYLCDETGGTNRTPVLDKADVTGDGTG